MTASPSRSPVAHAPESIAPNEDSDPLPGKYLFYRCSAPVAERTALPEQYSWLLWRPSAGHPWPRPAHGVKTRGKFLFRSAIHFLGLFSGDECGALLILQGNRIAHYSQFSPRYWRFPGMQEDDLQIGDTWTDPAHRGRGLASFALERIITATYKPGRNFWYVVGAANAPSIRVVERAGFMLLGQGSWIKPLGIKLLGSYVMDETPAPPAAIVHS